MKSRLKIGHLILLFALAVLPFVATFALPYPDERHYTDGALTMLRDHDWLVPKTPDGHTRFEKPPLAYWAVAAGFRTLGVSPFAARLPFLLACCGTIFLTWRLAQRLTKNNTTAQLAAVILLAHTQFIFSATRAMPDALLIFAVTLSATGFLRLIALGELTTGAFAMAYGGAALAAMSKGLLGVAIVLFAWAFVIARERKFSAVKKLLHWPSLAIATAVVAAWFAYIIHRYGGAAWSAFFGDQVTTNLHGHWWSPLARLPQFAVILAINFLPWSLPALEAWWRGKLPPLTIAHKFILAWCAALVVGFSLGANVSLRYLLPAAPLASIFVAQILMNTAGVATVFSLEKTLKVIIGALLVFNLAALGVNAQWSVTPSVIITVVLFAAATLALGWGALRDKWFSMAEGLGLAWLLFVPLAFFAANSILLPDPCQQMAMTVRRLNLDPAKPILFIGKPAMASGVRLFLRGHFLIVRAKTEQLDLREATNFTAILLPATEAGGLIGHGFAPQPAALIPGPPPVRDFWSVLRSRTLPEALERHGTRFVLAVHE